MAKRFVVDAYNVMHRMDNIQPVMAKDLEKARHLFSASCGRLARQGGHQVNVVFDGRGNLGHPTSPQRGVKVVYSRNGESADGHIKHMVDRMDNPRLATVVTSDREIVRYVRQYGCAVLGADEFAALLERAGRPSGGEKPSMKDENLDEWLKLFSDSSP